MLLGAPGIATRSKDATRGSFGLFTFPTLLIRFEAISTSVRPRRYLDFSRIPAEFEPYYLGVESKEKHALIDLEEASEELIRIFQDEDTRLTRHVF